MEFTFEAIGTNTFLTYMADIEEFDEFSMKMLEHNEIEGILPFFIPTGESEKENTLCHNVI